MIEQDTIKLLRECDAGIKMGVSAIEESLDYVKSDKLKKYLEDSYKENDEVKHELQKLLDDYHDDGKEPNAMAKGMSWIKTNVKLSVNESDNAVADLITDGCNMGIKTLNKYLNQYKMADEISKKVTEKLIRLEEDLRKDLRIYL